MKLIAVLFLYFVSCSAYHDQCTGHNVRDRLLKCVSDSGASLDDLSGLLFNQPAKSEKGKCFRACFGLSCNYLSKDGHFYADTPKRLGLLLNGGITSLTQVIEQSASHCISNTPRYKSLCDTTEAFVLCFIKKSPVKLLTHGVFFNE